MKNATPILMLLLSGIYLLNFTVGVLELPDYLPIVGNLDEAMASLIFITALKRLGVDLTEYVPMLGRRSRGAAAEKA